MANNAMSSDDLADLRYAKSLLKNPSLAARIASAIGTPIEIVIERLPEGAREIISTATTKSLETALDFVTSTMDDRRQDAANWAHKIIVAATGAAGGAFGLPALTVELPVSEKAMAQALPIVGAAGGALINTLFIDHFQDVGRGHFIVRRLERAYDPELIRREYLKLSPKRGAS
jgi:hypothetical protein